MSNPFECLHLILSIILYISFPCVCFKNLLNDLLFHVLTLKPFTLCEYSAKNTTRLTTSTQKTPITTTLSTSKTNNTTSKATTPAPKTTTKYTNMTTERISETTTQIYPLGKDPRLGDNNITGTETPGDDKLTTTTVESLITAITDSTTSEETTFTTEYYPSEKTTFGVIPSDHNTKRPRVETTLEVEEEPNWNVSSSTEPMETTTNLVLTVIDETTDIDHTTIGVSVGKSVRKACKSTAKDCGTDEVCIKKECFKVCETNGNVTKLSDDCVKGTSENNYFVHDYTFIINHTAIFLL